MGNVRHTRRASRVLLLGIATATMGTVCSAATPGAQEVVRSSVEAIQSDWAQASRYSYLERDVESKRRSPRVAKTYRVLMIDGSPYNVVNAINDEPLSQRDQAEEQQKLQREIEKRRGESDRERKKRIAKYQKDRDRDHQMLAEMVDAFQFRFTGEAQVNGHSCWVLAAEPKPGYQPSSHEGRVLKGMQGQLWIDKATHQWVKVHAEVVKPVSFFGFIAKVGPGTEFDLEQAPVAAGIWLPTVFNVRVKASALGFNQDSSENDTYRDYQPMPQASALFRSTK
jgi:hypothetical protein